MDRQFYNKGFLLTELCIVIFILSIIMVCIPRMLVIHFNDYYRFSSIYAYQQSLAILEKKKKNLEMNLATQFSIYFNEYGNINQAQTVLFHSNNIHKKIIIELGGGRLVYK